MFVILLLHLHDAFFILLRAALVKKILDTEQHLEDRGDPVGSAQVLGPVVLVHQGNRRSHPLLKKEKENSFKDTYWMRMDITCINYTAPLSRSSRP